MCSSSQSPLFMMASAGADAPATKAFVFTTTPVAAGLAAERERAPGLIGA